MIIKKYIDSYNRFGFSNLVNRFFSKLGIKFKLRDDIFKKRVYLSKKINEICDGKVIDGVYKGTKLVYSSDYFTTKPAYLLGFYEKEVQDEIFKISNERKLKNFINVGAGEGYHSVGTIKSNLFSTSISFELDKKNREIIKQNFNLNGISSNFKIYEKADLNFLNLLNEIDLSKSLFLFDIEGDEFNILNEKNLNLLKKSYLIIEIHHFYSKPNIVKSFEKNLTKFYSIDKITTQNRNYSNFKFLNKFNDDEKWLMMSESRSSTMKWLVCKPLL